MKTALCTTLAEVFAIRNVTKPTLEPIQSLNLTTTVKDRAFCEEDVQDQQLLPYLVTARHIAVGCHAQRQYFMYRRGEAGTEAKLHDKLSIGLGGHVDNGVPENEQRDQPFLRGAALNRLLQHEAAREYKEECGVEVEPKQFEFSHFIIDPLTDEHKIPVASVHLGLLSVLDVSFKQSKSMTGEGAICVDPQWVTLDELLSPEIYARLETWSRLVVDALYAGKERRSFQGLRRYQSDPALHIVTVQEEMGDQYAIGLPSALDQCIVPHEVYKLPEPTPRSVQEVLAIARLEARHAGAHHTRHHITHLIDKWTPNVPYDTAVTLAELKTEIEALHDPKLNVKAAAITILDHELTTHRAQMADGILERFTAETGTWPISGASAHGAIAVLSRVVSQVKAQGDTGTRHQISGDDLARALAALTISQLATTLRSIPLKSKHIAEATITSSATCNARGEPASFMAAFWANPADQVKAQ